ncbi:HEAT repeat domain-containing protein [Colwellia piezophila]|uniref:HEAT repeat domain-containing protein n=1 Tax=Colwellia piezophila TaxID=211668 RepID=UPI00036A200E|nr:HEAT repeat domain-containing protein [Colwellia piezophila]
MKNQKIIDWKIASLANNDNSELSEEMQSYLKGNKQLQEELLFIEQFWTNDVKPLVMPSDKLDANFYQMLSRAQSVQQYSTQQETAQPLNDYRSSSKEPSHSLMDKVKSWFMPTAIAQFATLALVFVLGFNLNQTPNNDRNSESYSGLQQDISSLTTVLAMSMLQKDSASARLSGVAYSRQTDLSNPLLVEQLIKLLARDKSTSVRLAIINSLGELASFGSSEQQLFTLAIKEENLLVQIELCRLLLNYGSVEIKNLLTEQGNQQHLKPEVQEFIKAQSIASYI